MTKIAAIALLLWLPTTVNAQSTNTVTGTVVKRTVGPRWTGIVISDGNQDYGIETSYQASAGEQMRGETGREVPTSGNLSVGRQVTVWYTKMDCSTLVKEGACLLTATKIVEIQRRSASGGPGTWDSFWLTFRSAVRRHDRSALRDMMSNPFEYSGANPSNVNPDFVLRDLNSERGEGWAALQRTIARIPTAYKLPNSRRPARVVKNPLPCGRRPCDYTEWIIFELGTDGRWRWISLIHPGD